MNVGDLKKYKDSLYSSLCRDIGEFEKNFLFISGGLLAFSITFIKDIIKLNEATWMLLLFISWGLIIISIAVMMYSFLSSATASNTLWNIVNDHIVEHDLYDETKEFPTDDAKAIKLKIDTAFNPIKKRLSFQRWLAVWSFIFGVLLFSTFVGTNLLRERSAAVNVPNGQRERLKNIQITITDTAIILKPK